MRRYRGFTLTELAVVMTIVAFLLASLMYTLSAQSDQRNFEETRRRLEQARELVLAFAVVNGRLPCPARSAATAAPVTVMGDEVRNAAVIPDCVGDAVTDYYGGTSGGVTLGLLPARAIGFQQVDAGGLAVDAWANPIRYAVAYSAAGCAATLPHWTNAANMKTNGVGCQPNDLLVCKSASGITASTCGGAANQIMTQGLVVAVIYSTGKNYLTAQTAAAATAAGRSDEAANLNGNPVFVFHLPTPSDFANGEFDDQMVWITVGELYGKLLAAGKLP
jgi:prepilin-type N-terminal cleavage/methylation domain-containing protein